MKKIIPILMLFLLIPFVSAQEMTVEKAGITPDNPLWKAETFFEDLQLRFTLNREKKINLSTQFAEERLMEIQKLQIRQQAFNYTKEKYAEFIQQAQNKRNQNIKLAENEANTERLRERLRERIEAQEQLHNQTMERVKEIVANATEEGQKQSEQDILEKLSRGGRP